MPLPSSHRAPQERRQYALDGVVSDRNDLENAMVARDSHELMRSLEVASILDCADMAAAASLFRTESRWGFYHYRVEYPEKNDDEWFCHSILRKQDGRMITEKRPVTPYIVPVERSERSAYDRQRIRQSA